MDQNVDHERSGGVPQKPFTEKNDYIPTEQPHMPQPDGQPYASSPEQVYVPQQQAFTPQPVNRSFVPSQQPQNFCPEQPLMPREQPYVPPQPAAPFESEQRMAAYPGGVFADTGQQGFTVGSSGGQPAYPPQSPYGQPDPRQTYASASQQAYARPKQRTNKGLIAVIIVLSVLLAGSLCGIMAYVLFNGSQHPNQEISENNNFGIRDFTIPNNGGIFRQEETTAPVHKESDYSDKVVPDYGGLTLESKPSDAKDSKYTSSYAFDSVSDSVVGIMCYADTENTDLKSQGSGIILSQGGYIITNAHVIGNSKTAYSFKVITADGKEYSAGVVGFDSRTDLAVLKMDGAENLKPATIGDSDALTLGEDIIIVGNPGGINYQNSMTKGIVSALDRDASNKSIIKYIQTDAAINPGNSGGPAVNMYGQVVGVATSKIADVTYEGMAFCIPTRAVKSIVDSLIQNGYVENRVKIGIAGVAVDLESAAYNNVPQGIYVQEIDKDGPCSTTKLTEGDIVTALDGEDVTSFSDIYRVLEKHKDGDKVMLQYYQASSGKEVEEEITLAADK